MANKPMDIRERTFEFSIEIIRSIEKIPHTRAGNAIANQLSDLPLLSAPTHRKLSLLAVKLTSFIRPILHFVKREKHYIGYDY
jgi:hypothetical protein